MEQPVPEIYSYPIRTSTAIVVTRVITTQLFLAVISLVVTLPIVTFTPVISKYLPILMLYACITLVIQTINMLVIVTIFLRWISTIYIIRQNEIITQSGIWSIQEHHFATEHTQRVTLKQSLWGKLFNFGTVEVYNPVLGEHLDLCDIPQPKLYASVLKRFESKETIKFVPRNAYGKN